MSTDFTQSIELMRDEIARGSTRANFSPTGISTSWEISLLLSAVGVPETETHETENTDDQAKR